MEQSLRTSSAQRCVSCATCNGTLDMLAVKRRGSTWAHLGYVGNIQWFVYMMETKLSELFQITKMFIIYLTF